VVETGLFNQNQFQMARFSFFLLLMVHPLFKLALTQNLKRSNLHRLHCLLSKMLKLTGDLPLLAISLSQDFFVMPSDFLFEMQQVLSEASRESA
jgi:hypothetical protein